LEANVYHVETLGGDDRDITNIRPAEALRAAGIALVPQYRSVFPQMTVQDNLTRSVPPEASSFGPGPALLCL
jgi:ABC-type branched-subunit amino acid transport system ATPase component